MSPWFVVGGRGFIGTNLAKRRECTTFDLVDGQDAREYLKLVAEMRGHDTVVHLAANADIAAGAENPSLDFDGIDITRNVCKAARQVGVKRIIYTSGSGVYGHRSINATEETPCFPVSSYGAAKLASEAILQAYEQYGIEVTIFRPANIVGPHQTHGVGFDFLRKLRKDPTRLEILGDGTQTKQYVHVDDLLRAFEIAAPGTWNVGSPDQLSVDVIARMACARLGVDPEITYTGGLAWAGDIPNVNLNWSALKRVGWCPKESSARAMNRALYDL
jgi:UDP-glucose 4-epimerase